MKTSDQYMVQNQRTYQFRIKTVFRITNDDIVKIKTILKKYDVKSVSKIRKTVFQNHPLDFSDIVNTEVYIVDITTGMPASSYVIQQELRLALGISEKYINVRADNEPIELESERINTLRDIEKYSIEHNLIPSANLSCEVEKLDTTIPGDETYGEKYTRSFLDHLAEVRRDRAIKIDPPAPLFSNLKMPDMPISKENFNDNIKGVGTNSTKTDNKDIPLSNIRSSSGNFDDDRKTYVRTFQDVNGNRIAVSKETSPVRYKKD